MQETTSIDLFFSFNLQVSQVFIFFYKLFAFLAHSFDMMLYYLFFFLKKEYLQETTSICLLSAEAWKTEFLFQSTG
jgi:hypothetical protein